MEHSITCLSERAFAYEDVKQAQMLGERGVFFLFFSFFPSHPVGPQTGAG